MKLAGILTLIGAFGAKVMHLVKAASKLKTVKKEVLEAYTESKEAYEIAMDTIKKIESYFTEESDGGKKLTMKEITEATELVKKLAVELKQATTEIFEAKDSIKNLIDSFKKNSK